MDNAHFKNAIKALGEPSRLKILLSLGLQCRPVSDVIRVTKLSQTNVSFHLRVLREVGFVRAERRGPRVFYCLSDPKLLHILDDLKQWIERAHDDTTLKSKIKVA